VKLLVQPSDGIAPLLSGIKSAKKSIEIVIFRLDHKEIEKALKEAVARGVSVNALIAYTNQAGERNLRELELRLLAGGVTVTRTANDLVRYHSKFMIIDRRVLYLLAFNYTRIDINRSRSFGIVTRNRQVVQEAVKLFEADTARQSYNPTLDTFIVSPLNARKQLTAFIKGARKQLLIYDNRLTDRQMIRLLQNRAQAGVEVKIIGQISKQGVELPVQKLRGIRLHARVIIRDGHQAFVGSQSLRKVELDGRREVGIIVRDPQVVKNIITAFEADWKLSDLVKDQALILKENVVPAAKAAKKAVKAIASDLPALVPLVREAVVEAVAETTNAAPKLKEVEKVVKEAVKDAVKEAVKEAVEEVVQPIENVA
jgi:phosphatidylserine/phosphatidylglycerophosphate/cardiolipin synthase-like enzyme